VPNGTKIERKYFYVNITFLTPHPTGCQREVSFVFSTERIIPTGLFKSDNLKYTPVFFASLPEPVNRSENRNNEMKYGDFEHILQ
jgi:hypothetical protein